MTNFLYYLRYSDKTIPCVVEVKPKKNISIQINENGEVIVRSTFLMKKHEIIKFIESKKKWIYDKRLKVLDRKLEKRNYENGEKFLLKGKEYILQIINDTSNITYKIKLDNKFVYLYLPVKYEENEIKSIIMNFYFETANKDITNEIIKLANTIKLYPEKIRVKNLKRSWGICYGNNSITINMKLIMAPRKILEYVIIHELCHLEHKNHSKEFWKLVEHYCPQYEERKKWLNENSNLLVF